MFKGIDGPLVLIVLDGVGETATETGNAIKMATMPFWQTLRANYPMTTLKAHGRAVGLSSDKDMGNSEVGHNALGAGQIYDQGAKLVKDAIDNKAIFEGGTWKTATERVRNHNTTLHFIGLLSDGNVHSHIDHLLAMLDRANSENVQKARVHVLLDGRDVPGVSAHTYIQQLETALQQHNETGRDYQIASGGGRMTITMDRYEADWDMVHRGWQIHVQGEGRSFPNAMTALETLRSEQPGIIDQDLPGFVIKGENGPVGPISDGDSVLFFNFRGDRAIEFSRAFDEGDSFTFFNRGSRPDVFYAGMMQYDGDLPSPNHYLVGPPNITDTLTEYLVDHKITQYAISETQKYGHVTYFWNGNRSGKMDEQTEEYVEIPSDNVSFDQRPWMKAAEITDALSVAIASGKHRFLRVNYANGDMVGHTGNLDAAIIAMGCLDLQLKRLLKAVETAGGIALITADHGNADEMFELDKKGNPKLDEHGRPKAKTSHTLNPVPLIFYDPHAKAPAQLVRDAEWGIGNVASTVAELLGLPAPKIWQPSVLKFV